MAARLAPETFAAMYSSDLRRACDTADAIAAAHNLKVTRTPALRELNFGHCEGLTFDQISERYPESITVWRGVNCDNPFSGGESMRQLANRVSPFLDGLKNREPEDRVLVVAHNGPIAVMICLLLGIGIEHWWQFKTANASLSQVETFELGAVLTMLNDSRHLEERH